MLSARVWFSRLRLARVRSAGVDATRARVERRRGDARRARAVAACPPTHERRQIGGRLGHGARPRPAGAPVVAGQRAGARRHRVAGAAASAAVPRRRRHQHAASRSSPFLRHLRARAQHLYHHHHHPSSRACPSLERSCLRISSTYSCLEHIARQTSIHCRLDARFHCPQPRCPWSARRALAPRPLEHLYQSRSYNATAVMKLLR